MAAATWTLWNVQIQILLSVSTRRRYLSWIPISHMALVKEHRLSATDTDTEYHQNAESSSGRLAVYGRLSTK
jgi:hypothetical protein